MDVGILGLGRMGLPMARHLIAAGHAVSGFDPRVEAAAAARVAGVAMLPTPAGVGAMAEATLVIVGFDDEVLSTCLGAEGLLAGARPGSLVIVCSTVLPETVQQVAETAARTGVATLDAPLCRAEHAAVSGDLLVLVGGDEADYRRAEPIMRTFASDVAHLGGIGAGQIGKMVNNYLLWAAVVADYEGLRFGMAKGLDLEALRQALLLSSGDNWALRTWTKGRPMPWAEKDMRILLESAAEAGMEMPLACSVADLIAALRQQKEGWRVANGVPSGGDADSMSAYMAATPPSVREETETDPNG
jgi:3-hydroxyisobutyrate dehydrogenase-like beta-hydroxyacid dehydrogenase